MSRFLIIDDEASICWSFREFLGDDGHEVDTAASAEEGLQLAERNRPDAVVLDVRLPGKDGLSALRELRGRIGSAPVIVITGFGNLETAVRAMEEGAFDYLVKPFDLDQAAAVLKRALEREQPNECDGEVAPQNDAAETLIGSSPAIQALFKSIALVAPTDVPVLITGESGTGKDLVARAIHRHSARRDGPFLPICLAALSPSLVESELFGHVRGAFTGADQDRRGLLELARGGTVLLDEIGDIAPAIQVKLLRAIEHREVTPVGDARPRPTDIRVIAATNRPLSELMDAGQFREDLFFRLSVFQIHVAPLRDRRDDIPLLAEHFLRRASRLGVSGAQLSDEVLDVLRLRHWPGNIRELRNTIEHAAIVARGRAIRPEHLPPARSAGGTDEVGSTNEIAVRIAEWAREALRDLPSGAGSLYERFLELTEPAMLRAVLETTHQNRAAAAEALGIHRSTLRQKLRKYQIE